MNCKTILLLLTIAAITSCSDSDFINSILPDSEKEVISFSMSSDDTNAALGARTRAGEAQGFESPTRIIMRIQSDEKGNNGKHFTRTEAVAKQHSGDISSGSLYHPDVHLEHSDVIFNPGNERYWDDTFGRKAQISVFALAIPNTTDEKLLRLDTFYPATNSGNWGTANNNKIEWSVDLNQTSKTPNNGDLVYSNNIQDDKEPGVSDNVLGKGGVYTFDFTKGYYIPDLRNPLSDGNKFTDGRLEFHDDKTLPYSDAGRFDKGHMVFHHALTRLTVHLKVGEGYTDGEFKFQNSSVATIQLQDVPCSGTFDVPNGTWTPKNDTITKMAELGTSVDVKGVYSGTINPGNVSGYYQAQFLPGYKICKEGDNGAKTFLTFTINDNKYNITQKMVFDALTALGADLSSQASAESITMEPGRNYKLTITVNKTPIVNLTAQLVNWETVTAAEFSPSNARITLNVEDRTSGTSEVKSDMDIYRSLILADAIRDDYETYEWSTGYTTDGKAKWNKTTLTYNTDKWSTDWFWESNKHYYHIRTLSPTSKSITQDSENGDYTTITSSKADDENSYDQSAWGAPFKDVDPSYKFAYDPTTNGFDGTTPHQIYKAIGPTKDQIKVLMFHLMSGVHFTVKTTNDADKVELFDGTNRTKIEIVGYYPEGKVRIGTGFIEPDGTVSTEALPYNVQFSSATSTDHYVDQEYYLSAIPQDITNFVINITTPDNNRYIVNLKEDIKATSVTNYNLKNPYTLTDGKYTIDRWYPGFKYNYTFTLKKTGIVDLKATVLDWETVTADNEIIQIK